MPELAELIKHQPPMRLIDRFISGDHDSAECEATIREDNLFYREEFNGLPAHVGVELMAQTIAAAAGYRHRDAGQDIKIGFLLGSRHYRCSVASFEKGQTYTIKVSEIHSEASGLSVFECTIWHADKLIAQAKLNVYQPPDEAAFIKDTYE